MGYIIIFMLSRRKLLYSIPFLGIGALFYQKKSGLVKYVIFTRIVEKIDGSPFSTESFSETISKYINLEQVENYEKKLIAQGLLLGVEQQIDDNIKTTKYIFKNHVAFDEYNEFISKKWSHPTAAVTGYKLLKHISFS